MINSRRDLLVGLIRHGLLIPTGIRGVFGWGSAFEQVVASLDAQITRLGGTESAEIMRFPPVTSRSLLEACGYLQTFPQLLGTIHAFCGNEQAHLELLRRLRTRDASWAFNHQPLELALTPAACYPVYPVLAERGPLPAAGCLVDVASFCFRHEPSDDPARMQAFRLREFVRVGAPEVIVAFRDAWLDRAMAMIDALGLTARIVPANDAFFGTQQKFLAAYQDENKLKFELQIGMTSDEDGTACMSFNCHLDHFSRACNIRDAAGELAHSGCVGFGLERLALALIAQHGFDVAAWFTDILAPRQSAQVNTTGLRKTPL